MNPLARAFPGRARIFLPVIHVEDGAQAMRNAALAREAGADGVFLIMHWGGHQVLLPITERVVAEYPGWFVGLNCLDLHGHEVVQCAPAGVGGIWSDNAGIASGAHSDHLPQRFAEARAAKGWTGLHFGGVAFKHQGLVTTPEDAARQAMGRVDVICTSGPGTGIAADVGKIADMRRAIGTYPMALASGVTVENVDQYLPYVDAFLVASGICATFTELDPERTAALAEKIHRYAG